MNATAPTATKAAFFRRCKLAQERGEVITLTASWTPPEGTKRLITDVQARAIIFYSLEKKTNPRLSFESGDTLQENGDTWTIVLASDASNPLTYTFPPATKGTA